MGPEVTQEWQQAWRRQLCGQLGTSFLVPEARESHCQRDTPPSDRPSPGDPTPGVFPGPPREKALLFSTIALVGPILVGSPMLPDTFFLVIPAQHREKVGGAEVILDREVREGLLEEVTHELKL